MKRWVLVVAALYFMALTVLTVPALVLAFGWGTHGIGFLEAVKAYGCWPYWLWIAVMVLGQAALLTVPVRVASRRPVTRGSLWPPILAAGLMAGGLVAGAIYSLSEFAFRDKGDWNWISCGAVGLGAVIWCFWTVVFYRLSRNANPADAVSRQCRLLLKGSILELLIAVPTHIVARYRDYCCAGFMTFIGLTMGISVMLFSFGPAVFFLFVERWRRLHPEQDAT